MTLLHPYSHRQASLATRHDKWPLIAPVMSRVMSLEVVNVDVDTDSLGTFSGDVVRRGSPFDTAVAKARLGMRESGLTIGIANEGTIGPHASLPFIVSDTELVVLVDDERGIVIADSATELAIPSFSAVVHPDECESLELDTAGFPEHGLIVMPSLGVAPIVKGVHTREALVDAARTCSRASGAESVLVQSDFRAHHHPSRRLVIERAAHKLAERVAALCPSCDTPGWGVGRHEFGASCAECGTETSQLRAEIFTCVCCAYKKSNEQQLGLGADPMYCPRCNP